ncbi:MAG TPA: DMT family transporter, partial [Anaerolineaceae bacterium]|nr:DMT family transporter [Anaerolineaceae bacterium]
MEQTSQHTSISPKIVLFVGVLAVSTASIFIRFAQAEASSLTIAAYRLGLATLIMAPFALRRSLDEIRRLTRIQVGLVIASGAFLAVHFATWITSLEYTSVASSAVFVTTDPLWVALLSPLLLREKLTRPVILGLAITLIGGIVVAFSDVCTGGTGGLTCPSLAGFFTGRAALGNLLALIGAWMAAGYLMIGRRARAGMSLLAYTFLVYGISAVLLIILALVMHAPFWGFSPVICV